MKDEPRNRGDVDDCDGTMTTTRRWWRRIFGDGAVAEILAFRIDEMGLQGRGGEPWFVKPFRN
ncbi:hypothetical protein Scep_016398 [Stephania cephalantha]|uniref:Uncharacterized protein n=1 Tax=Stephania cephalantha TaxID=152367 RepID=A0AAP0INE1_9MAGN